MSDSHTIKAKTSSVLVGVEKDNNLRWKQYVKQIKMKATTSISALSCLAEFIWSVSFKTFLAFYQAIVIPQITYCCLVWYSLSGLPGQKKYILTSLQTIQRRANRVVTDAFKDTSYSALDIEAFVLPIGFRLEKFASESLLRIASSQLYETIIKKRSN